MDVESLFSFNLNSNYYFYFVFSGCGDILFFYLMGQYEKNWYIENEGGKGRVFYF